MAFLASFSLSCTPHSRLVSVQKPHSLSPSTSLFIPQHVQKTLYNNPLRHDKRVNSRKAVNGKVKAAIQWEKGTKNVEVFSKEHLAVSLAYDVAQLSDKFTKERGVFTIVLSGGSLVKYLRKLVEPPYLDSLEWSKWHVFWVEEKVVPKDDLDSNYKLAYDGLLFKVPIPANNVYSIDDALPADGAADVYETTLRRLVKSKVIALSTSTFPKFDLMLLGMGPDGHIASLFPEHPILRENQKWVSFIKDSPKLPSERITLTLPVINSSSNVAMVVTGAGKADAVYSALEDDQKSDKVPARLVSPEGELKWFLDKGAASKLIRP